MDRAGPDAPAVKPEPGSAAESDDEGAGDGAPYTDIDISHPDIKQECSEYSRRADQRAEMSSNNAGWRSAPWTAEGGDEGSLAGSSEGALYTDIDISYPDIKQECSEYSRKVDQRTDFLRIHDSVFANPTEPPPVPREEPELQSVFTANKSSTERTFTSTGDKLFSCLQCNYSCNIKVSLKRHELTHSSEKPFSCSLCDYTCNQNSYLKLHLLRHSVEKPFLCSLCNYSCIKKSYLNRHLFTHSDVKPFSCLQCNYSCIQKSDLNRHLLTHSDEKPFTCSQCNYSFNKKTCLKRHFLTHSGEKPFSCSQCNYSCNQKSDLNRHVLNHNVDKLFSCAQCNYSCNAKSSIDKHVFTHFGKKRF